MSVLPHPINETPNRLDAAFIDALRAIVGENGVRETDAQKHVYASDAYTLEKALPGAVVLPRTTGEVAQIMCLCHDAGVPVVPRGAGTGLAGGAMARPGEVLLCVSRMNRIVDIDLENRQMRAQAGVVNTYLTKAVAGDGFLYAPDPSSQAVCTLGGNVAANSGGPHTLKYGVTVNHILGVQVVLPDGQIVELTTDDWGYDLTGVVVGSEGTLGIVTEATVKLVPAPQSVRTLLAICNTIDDATNLVSAIIGEGILPAALEMIDQTILQCVEEAYQLGLPTDAGAVLLIEVDGPSVGLDEQAERIKRICTEGGARQVQTARDAKERARLWMARKKSIGTIGRLGPVVRHAGRRRTAHETTGDFARNRRNRQKIQLAYRQRFSRGRRQPAPRRVVRRARSRGSVARSASGRRRTAGLYCRRGRIDRRTRYRN